MDISTKLLVLAANIAKDEASLSEQLDVIVDLLHHAAEFEAAMANGREAGPMRDMLDDRAFSLLDLANAVRETNGRFAGRGDIAWTF